MASGVKKRMLVHTQNSLGWKTEEFYSISDAIKELRKRGLKFTDERAFFQPDYFGVIVGEDCLVEIEEVANDDEYLPIDGKFYIPLPRWAKENNLPYDTVKHASAKGTLATIKVGRMGRLYIDPNTKWEKKGDSIKRDGKNYLPLKKWAKREGVSDTTVRSAYIKGKLKGYTTECSNRKYYYIEEGEQWQGVQ